MNGSTVETAEYKKESLTSSTLPLRLRTSLYSLPEVRNLASPSVISGEVSRFLYSQLLSEAIRYPHELRYKAMKIEE